ncbi:30S ribosomal protein S20 [Candidatus Woesebacteria bacterium]|nr:30S ribosomal protein S20 [Candidatus Woesebacteria bacterium]
MPLLKNAKKALRVSKRKAVINQRVKSRMRTALKAVRANPTKETVATAYSAVDKAVKRNQIHKNKAARLKSQVAALGK